MATFQLCVCPMQTMHSAVGSLACDHQTEVTEIESQVVKLVLHVSFISVYS